MQPAPASPIGRASQHIPPRLIVSRPDEDYTERPTLAETQSSTESAVKGSARPAAIHWLDIDDTTPRRRRKRSNHNTGGPLKGPRSRRSAESEVGGGFFSKLARTLESGDSSVVSKPEARVAASRQQRHEGSARRSPRKEPGVSSSRKPVKHKVGGLSRRTDPYPRLNPSVLSVLSSLTRSSDRSSSSNTTITQQSYNKQHVQDTKLKTPRKRSQSEINATKRTHLSHDVQFMDPTSVNNGHDGQSIYTDSSSASSQYEASDAGSSELPETPSSHSSFPSPTVTRSGSLTGSVGSVAELRRKYDQHYKSSPESVKSSDHSPEIVPRNIHKLPKINDVAEDDERTRQPSLSYSEVVYDARQRSSSRTSRPPERYDDRLRQQQDEMRRHVAHTPTHHGQHLVDPVYSQHRSHSTSSNGSTSPQQAWQQLMAMQQYHHRAAPAQQMAYPPPPQTTNSHLAHPDRPPAPDAPDRSQVTIAGYELLARELSTHDSAIKPIYRKFSYLNHRILLHLQDELQELEERLRTVDEIVAQSERESPQPASRRGDAAFGGDWHQQRTLLLGRIFQKTEQYNRALKSFRDISAGDDGASPEADQVETYREWLKSKNAIHEAETKFLECEREDLLLPGSRRSRSRSKSPIPTPQPSPAEHHIPLTYLPLGLMLPLLLFSMIPTLAGRLVVTLLISIGGILVATSTTRIREIMDVREWAICGSVYVLIMAAIAGVVPQYNHHAGGSGSISSSTSSR